MWQTLNTLSVGYFFIIVLSLLIAFKIDLFSTYFGRVLLLLFMFATIFYMASGVGHIADDKQEVYELKKMRNEINYEWDNFVKSYVRHQHNADGSPKDPGKMFMGSDGDLIMSKELSKKTITQQRVYIEVPESIEQEMRNRKRSYRRIWHKEQDEIRKERERMRQLRGDS